MKSVHVITAILVLFLFSNCEEDSQCTEEIEISANINFKTVSLGVRKDTSINNLTVIGRDTPYYNNNNLNSISLALSQVSDTSVFKFTVDTVTDTISFYYNREHYMVSFECGFATRFTLEEIITQNKILDSVSIIKPNVDMSDETNILFYY
ncbi:MAG: hypothetical protein JSV22_14630 [Bacteroidales bacterium]|nr:MAG: hypothetical protein JSV22_14630 [Bacteroidales bacterium]